MFRNRDEDCFRPAKVPKWLYHGVISVELMDGDSDYFEDEKKHSEAKVVLHRMCCYHRKIIIGASYSTPIPHSVSDYRLFCKCIF